MYIKQLAIQGFKSYREQTIMEPFSPKHNVIVGRNGSGKSNFFWAIRFVLSDAYSSMTREERQALLHEGTISALSAFVEIIFDNHDNRFPTGKDEVVLRRTIGLKKDEYSLDKKSVTKTEVMNLLESAGFSRSNPYYIVPQGRITALTNAKDSERLALLKEVAGTRVYEQRRIESLKIMDETDMKRQKIEELLEYIEERLTQLEEEKKELQLYHEMDKERRCLQYSIFSRELDDISGTLDGLEEQRRIDLEESKMAIDDNEKLLVNLQELEYELKEKRSSLNTLLVDKTWLEDEREELLKKKAHFELNLVDAKDSTNSNQDVKLHLETELAKIELQITAKTLELDQVIPKAEKKGLYGKQARNAKYRNQSERDSWIKQEIKTCENMVNEQTKEMGTLNQEISRIEQLNELNGIEFEKKQDAFDQKKNQLNDLYAEEKVLENKRSGFEESKRAKWREEGLLARNLETLKERTRNAERSLFSMADRVLFSYIFNKNTIKGLESVRRIAERLNLSDKVYGPLYELFDVDERYQAAVEVIVGSSLFHVVVDSDETVTKILDAMNKEKSGRVTFMPLNRLQPKETKYPSSNDVLPMIKKLRFDPKYTKAFMQIFGKAVICPSLEIASSYARNDGLTAVTLDGDRADKKGALTGGYQDNRKSRLDASRQLNDNQNLMRQDQAKADGLKREIAVLQQESTKIKDRITNININRDRFSQDKQDFLLYSSSFKQDQERNKTLLEQKSIQIQKIESNISVLKSQIQQFREEIKTPMNAKLSSAENSRLNQVVVEIDNLEKEDQEIQKEISKLRSRKSVISIELESNLIRRRTEWIEKLENLTFSSHAKSDLASLENELNRLNLSVKENEKRFESTNYETEELSTSISDIEQTIDRLKNTLSRDSENQQNQNQKLEKYISRKSILLRKKEESTKNIRELGVLPEEAFEKYESTDSKKLFKSLHKVNEGLKKFSHVNKKAFEQYGNFTKQRENLIKRKDDLDKSGESISELIQVLDQRKDEAIQRTFKHVAKNFSGVWKQLVSNGEGSLIMLRKSEEENGSDIESGVTIDSYSGVAIKVSFNSQTDPGQRMSQLSGGQKSLVALALIFAIQRCDPAPFYLFDEIDAALDAQYRTSVANMINELSENAQFITTTFRPEMLVHGDKFYGVTFVDKVSQTRCIAREDAEQFVEMEQPN